MSVLTGWAGAAPSPEIAGAISTSPRGEVKIPSPRGEGGARRRRRREGEGDGAGPRLRTAAALLLVLAGLVLAGQGLWIHAKAMLAQVLLDRAFAETLETGRSVKPWPWADTWPVARIDLPRLGESAIALAGASGQALAFGPGHVQDTPEAGDPGTAVYAAHRDTHFRVLRDVKPGDEIDVTRRDGRRVTFRVTGTRVAVWDVSGIDPRAPGRNLVLATCWPFDATTRGPYRYLVEAEEVTPDQPKPAGPLVADATSR